MNSVALSAHSEMLGLYIQQRSSDCLTVGGNKLATSLSMGKLRGTCVVDFWHI